MTEQSKKIEWMKTPSPLLKLINSEQDSEDAPRQIFQTSKLIGPFQTRSASASFKIEPVKSELQSEQSSEEEICKNNISLLEINPTLLEESQKLPYRKRNNPLIDEGRSDFKMLTEQLGKAQAQVTYFESESTIKRPSAFTLTPINRPPQINGDGYDEEAKAISTRLTKEEVVGGVLHATENQECGPLLSESWLENMLHQYPKSEGDLPSQYRLMLEEAEQMGSEEGSSEASDFLENQTNEELMLRPSPEEEEEFNTPCKDLNDLFLKQQTRNSHISSINSKYIVSPPHPGKKLERKQGYADWKQTGHFDSEIVKQNEAIFKKVELNQHVLFENIGQFSYQPKIIVGGGGGSYSTQRSNEETKAVDDLTAEPDTERDQLVHGLTQRATPDEPVQDLQNDSFSGLSIPEVLDKCSEKVSDTHRHEDRIKKQEPETSGSLELIGRIRGDTRDSHFPAYIELVEHLRTNDKRDKLISRDLISSSQKQRFIMSPMEISANISPIESVRDTGGNQDSRGSLLQTKKYEGEANQKKLSSEVVLLKNQNKKLKKHVQKLYEMFRQSNQETTERFNKLERSMQLSSSFKKSGPRHLYSSSLPWVPERNFELDTGNFNSARSKLDKGDEDELKTERRAAVRPKTSREDEEQTDVIDGGLQNKNISPARFRKRLGIRPKRLVLHRRSNSLGLSDYSRFSSTKGVSHQQRCQCAIF